MDKTKLSLKEVEEDTKKGIEQFKKLLNIYPKYYAYPYGEYNKTIKNSLKKFNFSAIAHQSLSGISSKTSPFDLPRVALVGKIKDFKSKLSYKFLDATFNQPLRYPKDNILKNIDITFNEPVSKVQIYVSNNGWSKWYKVKNNHLSLNNKYHLNSKRVRIFVKTPNNKISSIILVK